VTFGHQAAPASVTARTVVSILLLCDLSSGLRTGSTMSKGQPGYQEIPNLPGYWRYDGLCIQADVDVHRFVVAYACRQLPRSATILDIAAGDGALVRQLQDQGFVVSATSWNDKCQAACAVFPVDLDKPFGPPDVGNTRYPLVTCVEIIEHLENAAAFLRHLAQVVTDDGRLILSTPNVESAAARLQWLFHGRPLAFTGEEIRRNRHIWLPWREGLEYHIENAGFHIEELHLLGPFMPGPGLRGMAKRATYAAMRALLRGDLSGTSRVYVLTRANREPRRSGPADVY
jgi:SAM-dependent methyltransferase